MIDHEQADLSAPSSLGDLGHFGDQGVLARQDRAGRLWSRETRPEVFAADLVGSCCPSGSNSASEKAENSDFAANISGRLSRGCRRQVGLPGASASGSIPSGVDRGRAELLQRVGQDARQHRALSRLGRLARSRRSFLRMIVAVAGQGFDFPMSIGPLGLQPATSFVGWSYDGLDIGCIVFDPLGQLPWVVGVARSPPRVRGLCLR